jgi:hypothetical protein
MISLENPGPLKISATKQADVNRHFFIAILSVGLTGTDHSGKFIEGSRVRTTSGLIPQRPLGVGSRLFAAIQCNGGYQEVSRRSDAIKSDTVGQIKSELSQLRKRSSLATLQRRAPKDFAD